MGAEVKIFSDLKFLGYSQDRRAGKNGQYLRYIDGRAEWSSTSDQDTNTIVTVPSSQDSLIDKDGNVVFSGVEEIYYGIDTRLSPNARFRGDAIFLGTQEEYDTQPWEEGNIFIPTVQGIIDEGIPGAPSQLDITYTGNIVLNSPITFLNVIGIGDSKTFLTSDDNNIVFFSIEKIAGEIDTLDRFEGTSVGNEIRLLLGSSVFTAERAAKSIEVLCNSLSEDPENPTIIPIPFSSRTIELSRNFEATAVGNTVSLTYIGIEITRAITVFVNPGDAIAVVEFTQAILPQVNTLTTVQDTMYVRREGNNGWIQFNTAVREFITG